jgi:hypothetical protein
VNLGSSRFQFFCLTHLVRHLDLGLRHRGRGHLDRELNDTGLTATFLHGADESEVLNKLSYAYLFMYRHGIVQFANWICRAMRKWTSHYGFLNQAHVD